MKKYNAFTFVELLMVMLVLGVIISLTMPLLTNLVNSDDINRSYMKKALQDVTDATALALIKDRAKFTDTSVCSSDANLRNKFKFSVAGTEIVSPTWTWTPDTSKNLANNTPGLNVGNKAKMYFVHNNICTAAVAPADNIGGEVYYDVNGDKKPNEACKDRFRFILYADRALLDTDCDLAIDN